MLRIFASLIAIGFLLAGCETYKPIPQGYAGPVAQIRDTVTPLGGSGADFFYVSKFDGKTIDNSMTRSRSASYGQGFRMTSVAVSRDVPASPVTITIMGRRDYAAPIQAMFSKIYQVSGEVALSPEAGESYVVKGQLGEGYSVVWLENEKTGTVIGEKFEVKGSAAVGILEK